LIKAIAETSSHPLVDKASDPNNHIH